jgi:hypothetical protein
MRHYLNDIEIAPRNLLDIGVISDFTDRPSELELNIDKLVLPREALSIIQGHIQSQGVFEGIPYRVEMSNGISLNYYVDLTEEAIFRSFEIEVKIKRRNAKDSFFDRASGTSFELMVKKGVQFQFIDVPYVLVRDNQAEVGLTLAISLYVMTKELISAIKDLAIAIADFINAFTPNAGAPSFDTGDIIALSLKALAQFAYTAAILVALIKLAQQLFDILFPKLRYYKACKVKELLSKGCQYLGYSFQSTLLDGISGLTILPIPIVKEKRSIFDYLENDLNFSFTKGYPGAQDSTPMLADLLTAMENQFNARTKVINGVVQLERRDYWQNFSTAQILPALVIQDERQDEYTLNTSEVWKRYYIHYQVDYADLHTLDFYDPTDAEYSTEPTNVINPDLVSIKGLNDVNIPFALGTRKEKLTWVESYAKFIFASIDEITDVFGGGTNLTGSITNRIGVLKLSQQFYGTTKLLYLIGQKQPANYIDFLAAKELWNKYHYINQIQLNDFQIRNDVQTTISTVDFVTLLDNNYAEIEGEVCEILRLEYLDERSRAVISYKRPFNYADGKVSTLVINE